MRHEVDHRLRVGVAEWKADLRRRVRAGVVHLEVRTDNATAIALYRSVGFTEVGLRRRYYRISGADAYTMRREAE